jgi:hypothetical protein
MSFFAPKTQATQQAAVSGLQLQSSAYGVAIPIVYGTTRVAPNLIWYGDFDAIAQQSSAGSGGKGGVGGGGGGKGGGGSTSYTYQTAVALGLCEGPITGIGNVYVDKNLSTLALLGLAFFSGTYGQPVWGYLTSKHPTQALGYSGSTYLAASAYQLGTSPQLPNHNFEVYGILHATGNGLDACPANVIADMLTNPHYGVGFPSARLGDFTVYTAYCMANGLWISPAYTQQAQSSSLLDDIATATNSAVVWSQGVLTMVPYGDSNASGNGYSYTAPSAPLYDLTDDDFMPNTNATSTASATMNDDPVLLTRSRASDAYNCMQLEVLDRNNYYNTAIVQAKDQALIQTYGLRQNSPTQMHMFADVNAAQLSVQLQLQRQAVRNLYQFTLDQRYVLLDPMDIVTLTDAQLGLNKQWVRITEITENDDSTLSISAEEYLDGAATAALYSFESGQGFNADYNADPGDANTPVIFEPTAELAGGLEVWLAASGGSLWGGCDVWLSSDGDSYKNIGRITGSARTGVLAAALPAVNAAATGQTIDSGDTLGVNLAESNGELLSGTQADALVLNTLCYVDGEYIAYQTATLTAANSYALTWLVRGAYDSPIGAHGAGAAFARLDSSIFTFAFTPDFIGTTVYIKLVGYNIYGGGQQSIAEVQPYAYTIQGLAYASPLPDVTNLRSSYIASITQLAWDDVEDFRPVLYEVRQGSAWLGAQVLGRVAQPPFQVQGNGTYWVAAYSQPLPGLQVYSETPQDIRVTGAQITSNVIVTWDEAATGWSGMASGDATVLSGAVYTTGAGNVLAIADYLGTADILTYGGEGDGTYTIPDAHIVNIGRVAACSVIVSWTAQGQHADANLLSVADFLGDSDVLDYEASANIDVYPNIAVSQDGVTWGAWQKYAAGTYVGQAFKAQMALNTYDFTVEAILSAFVFAVDVPDRDDHYVNLSIAAGGTSLAFMPDGAASPVPFNGGPQGSGNLPAVQVTILNAQSGDTAVVSALSLSGCTLKVLNGGAGVARSVNVLAEGY